jgi:hypothetical protein
MTRVRYHLLLLSAVFFLIPTKTHGEWDWQLWVANEFNASRVREDSPWNPGGDLFSIPGYGNDLVIHGMLSWKLKERLHLQGSFNDRLYYEQKTQHHFYCKEAFAVYSLTSRWDVVAGKKIQRWGTGYVFNPSGFIDPPKDPQDPQDRLDLRSGTELIELDWTRGSHAFNFVYTAPRLYFTRQPIGSRDSLAFRYNRLWKGLDFSFMGIFPSAGPHRWGGNFSYVAGQSLEMHGEVAWNRRDNFTNYGGNRQGILKSVLGMNYTFRNGWNVIGEWYHDGEGLSHLAEKTIFAEAEALAWEWKQDGLGPSLLNPAFLRFLQLQQSYTQMPASQNMLFLMGGHSWLHNRLGVQGILLGNLSDFSRAVIPQASYQFKNHWNVYWRTSFFGGKSRSQYGSLPVQAILSLGLRYSF